MKKKVLLGLSALLFISLSSCFTGSHQHTYSNTWSSDDTYHWRQATCEHSEEVIDKASHSFTDWVIDVAPTETSKGSRHKDCLVCAYTITESMDEVVYGQTTYSWSTDYESCTARRVSSNYKDKYEEETVRTTLDYITKPTETTDGLGTFTATFENPIFTTQVVEKVLYAYGSKDSLRFTLSPDGTFYRVSASMTSVHGNIIIPKYYKFLPVTAIQSHGFDGTLISTIQLTDFITEICFNAFTNCNSLVGITLPDSLKSIEYGAFYGCSTMNSVLIPKSVETIEENVFAKTHIHIAVDEENPNYASEDGILYNKDKTVLLSAPTCPDTVFDLPASVETIGGTAFNFNKKIETFHSTSNLKKIEKAGFANCSKLSSMEIGENVTTLGLQTFLNCKALENLSIPESIEKISNLAFDGCENLIYNEYDNGKYLGNSTNPYLWFIMASSSDITSLEINTNCKYIMDSGTRTLSVFSGYAFSNCSSLTSISIPDSVISIGSFAFARCTSLTTVTFGSGLKSIGDRLFEDDLTITSITVNSNNQNFTSEGMILYNKTKTKLFYCSPTFSGSYEIPNTVSEIAIFAFDKCQYLTAIIIPNTITAIPQYCFSDCSGLTSVKIPNSVTVIDDMAFSGCRSVTEFDIPTTVIELGWGSFNSCSSMTSFVVNEGVQHIYQHTFIWCHKLASITLPKSLKTIADSSFSYCEKLRTINYSGTKEDWSKIKNQFDWTEVPAKVVHCSDGDTDLLV